MGEIKGGHSGIRILIKLVLLVVFIGWMLVWIMRPTRSFAKFWNPVLEHATTKAYGATGAYTLIYTAPALFLAFVGAIYLSYTRTSKGSDNLQRSLKVNPWTYPVFVRGPLALVSAAELALLAAFVALYTWTTAKHLTNSFSRINIPFNHGGHTMMPMTMSPLWQRKFNVVGGRLGAAGAVPFAFLFFPVARFSSLMQLVNIPFEHAVKYHVWTGHIMMVIWSAHSLVYVIYWPIAHKSHEFITWGKTDISGLSGLLVWIVGLAIWMTSLNPVRKHKFELFYYTHQLYVVFIIGFALHVGEKWLAMMVAGIFLFFIDRVLRFLQSRRRVDVVSARLISDETMELTFAKHASVQYPAASAIFLNLPSLSLLQWHPFTVVTCSSVDVDQLSVLIKCNGRWTEKLRDLLVGASSTENGKSPLHLEAAIEGPHGYNIDYLQHKYKSLVFVAGGSGISPFISILKDLLYKIQAKQMTPPEKIALVWAVKKSDELGILHSISPSSICPDFAGDLNLDLQAYVTREDAGIDLEDNKAATYSKNGVVCFAGRAPTSLIHAEPSPSAQELKYPQKMFVRGVTGTHGYKLYAAVIVASFAGYMFLAALVHRFYIYPIDHNTFKVYSRSGRGFLSFLEYLVGTSVFGGTTALIWTWWNEKLVSAAMLPPEERTMVNEGALKPSKVHFGCRPDFQEIFAEYVKSKKPSDVGVFVCGPEGLQENVGLQCKAHMLNFHPLNYEL